MTTPLLVLGGADRKPHYLPPRGRDKHPLTVCKGADVQVGGVRLIDAVLARFRSAAQDLGPFYVAGPAKAYREVEGAALIDTDGNFGENLEAGIEAVRRAHPGSAIAITTCDVLPEPADLRRALTHYREHSPSDFWFPMVRLPVDERLLGASAWKPRYRILDANGVLVPVLPGHLTIFDPEALRLDFLYRLLQGAYRSRNRSVRYRRWYMIRRVATDLLGAAARDLVSFRRPVLMLDVLAAFFAARRLPNGLTTQEIERTLSRLFLHRAHRRRHPERGARLAVLEGLSLARDIDTVEEAEAFGAVATPIPTAPASSR
jgi:hypothetical protein